VRYPPAARTRLKKAGLSYRGWLPNYLAPEVFAAFALTVHIPRRPYVEALPGIPTIRVFEALACGIPLICAPWEDAEGLFSPESDYLIAKSGKEMRQQIAGLLSDRDAAHAMAERGRQTILERHTCGHRVDQLLSIMAELKPELVRRHRTETRVEMLR